MFFSYMLFVLFLSLKNHISDVKIIHFEELVDARTNNAVEQTAVK